MNWDYNYNTPMHSGAYWGGYLGHWAVPLGIAGVAFGGILLFGLIIWSLYWKGRSLWRAAHHHNKPWFVALLLINTLGILDILYIYFFSKKNHK